MEVDGGSNCITIRMYLMLLNHILKDQFSALCISAHKHT